MARLFEIENDRLEQQNKWKGIVTSVFFHGLLLLLFYFLIGVQKPFPPLSEQGGVMVNLGYMDDGVGEIQPMGVADQVEVPQPVKSNPPVKSSTDKIITTENPEAPVITKKKDTKKKDVKTQKSTPSLPVVEAPKTVTPPKPKAMYTGGSQNSNSSEGNGNKAGDKGQTNGSPFGDNYTGGPGINGGPGGIGLGGTNYNLKGRKMLTAPCEISDNSKETGTIVLKIKVDKGGKIVSADGPAQGSTTTSSYLMGLAKKSLSCCKFDAPSGVPDEQFGSITFNFKVK